MGLNVSGNKRLSETHSLRFENLFMREKGSQFEIFFGRIMSHAFPGDFEKVRPYGPFGDFKTDGFRRSDGTVFQCYAPETLKINPLLGKIKSDFHGAVDYWGKDMKRWEFVHNDLRGLPTASAKLLNELRKKYPNIIISTFTFSDLLGIVQDLKQWQLDELFGPDASREKSHWSDYNTLLSATHAKQEEYHTEYSGKIDQLLSILNSQQTANDHERALEKLSNALDVKKAELNSIINQIVGKKLSPKESVEYSIQDAIANLKRSQRELTILRGYFENLPPIINGLNAAHSAMNGINGPDFESALNGIRLARENAEILENADELPPNFRSKMFQVEAHIALASLNFHSAAASFLEASWHEEGEVKAILMFERGNALAQNAIHTGDRPSYRQAIDSYLNSIIIIENDNTKVFAGIVHNALGNVLRRYGSLLGASGLPKLLKAEKSYKNAIKIYAKLGLFTHRAITLGNLGNLYANLGTLDSVNNYKYLAKSEICHRKSIALFDTRTYPLDWALARLNLGHLLLQYRSHHNEAVALLKLNESVICAKEATLAFSREAHPSEWSNAKTLLGNALTQFELHSSPRGIDKLDKAVIALNEALEVRTEERLPVAWAQTKASLAQALHSKADLLDVQDRPACLKLALSAYQDASRSFKLGVSEPLYLAFLEAAATCAIDLANFTSSKSRISTLEIANDFLEEAIGAASSDRGLRIALLNTRIGKVTFQLYDAKIGDEKLISLTKCIAARRLAASLYDPNVETTLWSMAQSDVGNGLIHLSLNQASHDQRQTLTEALVFFEASLTLRMAPAHDAERARTYANMGSALELLSEGSERSMKAKYLRKSAEIFARAEQAYTSAGNSFEALESRLREIKAYLKLSQILNRGVLASQIAMRRLLEPLDGRKLGSDKKANGMFADLFYDVHQAGVSLLVKKQVGGELLLKIAELGLFEVKSEAKGQENINLWLQANTLSAFSKILRGIHSNKNALVKSGVAEIKESLRICDLLKIQGTETIVPMLERGSNWLKGKKSRVRNRP